jgi:hypothetical protein
LGSSGTSGTSGVNGTFFGSSGTSGINGITGDAGSSGTSGTNAPGFSSGTSGSGGSSGLNGTYFGSSGTSGTNAPGITSGTSGTSGFQLTGTTNNGLLTYVDAPVGVQVESAILFDGTTLSVTGNVASTTYRETFNDLGTGGSATLDLSTANNFRRQFNGTSTITITNAPNSPIGFGFTLVTVNAGAYSITWPVSVDWVGGSAPILTSSGTDVLVFYTYNGGSSYYGFVTGKNLS